MACVEEAKEVYDFRSLKIARLEELGRKQAAKIWDLERRDEDLKEKKQELDRKNGELEYLRIVRPDWLPELPHADHGGD